MKADRDLLKRRAPGGRTGLATTRFGDWARSFLGCDRTRQLVPSLRGRARIAGGATANPLTAPRKRFEKRKAGKEKQSTFNQKKKQRVTQALTLLIAVRPSSGEQLPSAKSAWNYGKLAVGGHGCGRGRPLSVLWQMETGATPVLRSVDAADAPRYLVATKSRSVTVRKLRGG